MLNVRWRCRSFRCLSSLSVLGCILILIIIILAGCAAPGSRGVPELAAAVKAVRAEGAGNPEAVAATRALSALGPEALPDLFAAMDDADPVARNWLRGAADAVTERTLAAGGVLPAAAIEAFVLDRRHAGQVRRLAYEHLLRVDPSAAARLIPRMLDDPSVEMRRDAVERELTLAEEALAAGGKEAGLAAFRRAFAAARDPDQVSRAAKKLETLGDKPDLTRHYGFVRTWRFIGPFDNTAPFDNAAPSGYDVVYPPETGLDFAAELPGKSGAVRWAEHTTTHAEGVVDFNALIAKEKGVIAYAAATVESPEERPVHIRAGSPNAIKIWLNGALIFTRNEYHHGMDMDQYRAPAVLRPGRNTILIKVCQNEQKEEWTESWMFRLRVCDATGGGLL